MKMRSLTLILALLGVLLPRPGGSVEPWADARLSVTNGLALWFDVASQNAARQSRNLPALMENGSIDQFFDGSGNRLDVTQRAADARPKFKQAGPNDFMLAAHPLAKGFTATSFTKQNFVDETYWNFVGNPGDVNLLASSVEDGEPRPQMWTRQIGKGRVFVSVPGHYNWTFDDPVFRVLALRGLCWAAGQPVDRLVELATVGARMEQQP